MIEVFINVRNLKKLRDILEWVDKEKIMETHPNIEIKIEVGTDNLKSIINEMNNGQNKQNSKLGGITIDLPIHDIQREANAE